MSPRTSPDTPVRSRPLSPGELHVLRQAAQGKLRRYITGGWIAPNDRGFWHPVNRAANRLHEDGLIEEIAGVGIRRKVRTTARGDDELRRRESARPTP